MAESPPSPHASSVARPRRFILAAAFLLILATVAAYQASFSVPFLYDDLPAIFTNPSILDLRKFTETLSPPADITPSGRPLVNLSLAINYAIGGTEVRGYHIFNLGIHLAAALTLFGVMRRTLLQSPALMRFREAALPLAFVTAALWTLHPLQTQSVTYVVQRAESLVGLFYFLTLYCFIRGARPVDSPTWQIGAVLACAAGMASKEVMVSAPLMVLLYDRTFVSGSFREAWKNHKCLYVGLAMTWLLLAFCVLTTGGTRAGTAGFGQGVSVWHYLLTQAKAIVLYLRLSLWPHPLVFDYGRDVVTSLGAVFFHACAVVILAATTIVALVRRPVIGFLGAWFFAILAPTSSIVPIITEPIAEHRMYLPLAAVVALVVAGVYTFVGKRSIPVFVTAALILAIFTAHRNEAYRTPLSLWQDTLAKIPTNGRAHYMVATALAAEGRADEALKHHEESVRLQPQEPKAYFSHGTALLRAGRIDEALHRFEETLRLNPDHVDAHNNYGLALRQIGRLAEAITHFQKAIDLSPDSAPLHNNLGVAFGIAGRLPEAVAQFAQALALNPDYAEAHNNLGYAFRQRGQLDQAAAHFRDALRLSPRYAEAHNNLALTLAAQGKTTEAISAYRDVLRLEPTYADGYVNLAHALVQLGQISDAANALEDALRIKPDHAPAQARLAELRATSTHPAEARH